MRLGWLVRGSVLVGGFVFLACSGNGRGSGFDDPSSSSGGVGSSGGGGFGNGDGGSSGGVACSPDPANYDIPGNNCDDDNDGTVDNPPSCDGSLSQGGSAEDFARALGICDKATEKGYGLVDATFTRGYGRTDAPQDAQHGVLSKFGNVIKPREGKQLGVLSTGYGEEYDGSGQQPFGGVEGIQQYGKDWYNFGPYSPSKKGNGTAPPGFPKAASGCTSVTTVNDVIDLKLTLKAPPNVSGIKFDFNFYSGEWPAFVCTEFNDGFIAYLTAKGFQGGKGDNMSFDKNNNPVSVNNGFFDRCTPGVTTGCAGGKTAKSVCPGGAGELGGTGFGIDGDWCQMGENSTNGGATGWLTSSAPVQAGETFTIEFMIWDTGDAILDSSVLLDNFTWAQGVVSNVTERPH